MKSYLLRNHIPIGGPATREPATGDEDELRLSLGFTPQWYAKKMQIDFGHKWHTDPIYRYQCIYQMKKKLNELFPMVPYFSLNYDNGYETTCATLSGVYGITVIPQCYGVKPVYFNDGWPDVDSSTRLKKEDIIKLKPFDINNSPLIEDLVRQMNIIKKEYGIIHGYLNYQGILNIAMKVYGNDFLIDMSLDESFIKHFFSHIGDTILKVSKFIQKKQRDSGFDIDLLSMSNCLLNLISPEMYSKFVLPVDIELSKEYQRFGIHTCNWDVTPYINQLKQIRKMGYIDMGIVSDLNKVKESFPYSRRAVLINPMSIIKNSENELREMVLKIKNELAPCDIVLAAIDPSTPDSKVVDFWNLVSKMML